MKKSDLPLGVYQVAGGLFSAFSLFTPMVQRHWSAVGFLCVFSALSIAAGALHLLGHPEQLGLSIINQLTQVLGFYTPWISIMVIHGAWVKVDLLFDWKENFAASVFTQTASAGCPESTCDVALSGTLPGLHTYGLSLNFLALGILIYCIIQRRKTASSTA